MHIQAPIYRGRVWGHTNKIKFLISKFVENILPVCVWNNKDKDQGWQIGCLIWIYFVWRVSNSYCNIKWDNVGIVWSVDDLRETVKKIYFHICVKKITASPRSPVRSLDRSGFLKLTYKLCVHALCLTGGLFYVSNFSGQHFCCRSLQQIGLYNKDSDSRIGLDRLHFHRKVPTQSKKN